MENPFLFISSEIPKLYGLPQKGYVDLTAKHVFVQLSEAFETVCLKVHAYMKKKI